MINNILNPELIQRVLKIAFVLGATIYLIYTFIVFRQISVMKKTLITKFSNKINILGIVNLFLAGAVFFGFIFFL